jgi:hypothetical protein
MRHVGIGRRSGAARVARLALGTGLTLITAVTGCQRAPEPRPYLALVGHVESADPAAGVLVVRLDEGGVPRRWPHNPATCQVGDDAELCVNGAVQPLTVLRPGDRVEVYGYVSPQAPDRLIVVQAYVDRPEPTPAPPDLAAVTSAPAGVGP